MRLGFTWNNQPMNAADLDLGPYWAELVRRGWSIRPTVIPLGTAYVDETTRTIRMKVGPFRRPSSRIRRYVLPHEVYHALHCELGWHGQQELATALGLTVTAAREALADGGVLEDDPSRLMRTWVTASVAWHSRISAKYRYRMAHCTAPETRALLTELRSRLLPPTLPA